MSKKNTLIRILAITAFLLAGAQVFIACKETNEDPKPVPTILGFSPASAMEGASVVITGTHFSTVKTGNIVKFNGTAATVADAAATQLTVTVPAGTTTGKITVEVNDQVVSTDKDFVFIPMPTAPTVTAINPATGAEGTVVVITGTHFSTTSATNLVKFNGVEAVVTNATSTQITTTVPAGATTGKVTVKVGEETGGSAVDFVVLTPTITGFTPATAVVGASVVITGINFGPASIVKLNGVTAAITNLTATQITATVPSDIITGKITVQVGTKIATSATDFTLLVLPTVTSFTAFGAIGKTITVIGTKFDLTKTNNAVKFNDVPAVVTEATSTQLKAIVPYGATTGPIKVTVNGTESTNTNGNFTVISSWTQKASFPGTARNQAFAFAINGKGYVGGGVNASGFPIDFYEFDPGTFGAGSWQQKKSLFAGGIYASTSFVVSSFGIVIDDGGDAFFYQGGNLNAWSYVNKVLVDNGAGPQATAFVLNNLAYIKNVDGAVNVYDFNINNDPGNSVSSYPVGASIFQSSFVIGSTAYVGGGKLSETTNSPFFNTFYSFTTTGGWKQLNNLPVSGLVTMFSIDSKGYLKQGSALYRYETITDSWTRLEDAPTTAGDIQSSFVIGSKAFIGLGGYFDFSQELWEFDASK